MRPSVILGVVIAVGAVLRLLHLGTESVWLDEAYSIQLARGSLQGILADRWTDIHPPLYYMALHAWLPVAGASEFGARLLSTLFDLMAIVSAFAIARRLVGERTALVAAALLAASPFHVEYAQEARMYALLGLLSTLSMQAFVTFFDRRRLGWFALYAVASALMLYTHIYGMFVLGAQAIIVVLLWMRDRGTFRRVARPWLAGQVLIFVLFIPWLATLINQITRVQGAFWIARPSWIAVLHPLLSYAGSVPLALALAPLMILGIRQIASTPRPAGDHPHAALVLLPWFAAPIVIPFLISQVSSPIFLPKYTIAASVPFAILVALGLARLRTRRVLAVATAAVVLGSVWTFYAYHSTVRKEGWRHAVTRVESLARPNDLVVFYPAFNQVPYDYYRQRGDLVQRAFPLEPYERMPDLPDMLRLVQQSVSTHDRVWLVVLQGDPGKTAIADAFAASMTPLEHSVSQRVELFLFEKTP